MFLWLNCFVASIECVPGLDLNSCAGLGVCSTNARAVVGRGMNNDDFAGVLINARAPALPGLVAALHACAVAGSPQKWCAGPFGGRFGGAWDRALPEGLGMSVPSLAVMLGRSVHPSPVRGPFSRCESDFTGCAAAGEPWCL